MTSTSRSLEDFLSRLKTLKADLQAELAECNTRLSDLRKAKATLENIQAESGIIASYNSQAVKDIERRIAVMPENIKRVEERLTSVDGALHHAVRYDRDTCQHTLKVSGHDYHNNVEEYTCTKCGEHR